jgi:hypothetical protein
MKLETEQMFKRLRWFLFSASLGVIAVGYSGFKLFEHLSYIHHDHEHTGINIDDLLELACFLLMGLGMILCVLCCIWIIISTALSCVRRLQTKQPNHR